MRNDFTLATTAGEDGHDVSPEAVLAQLARLLRSATLAHAPILRRLLHFLVVGTLEGRGKQLKEYTVGVEVFERGSDFDPSVDTIVRAHARRLRAKLREYYSGPGADEPILIDVPKGAYTASFRPAGNGASSPARSDARVTSPEPPDAGAALPALRTTLIGRDDTIAAVTTALLQGRVRLVTLAGPGGSGKTQLAVKVARDVTGSFAGRMYYLALGSVTDPDVAAREIAHAVGLRQTDGRSLAEAVADHLRRCVRKPSLLVLDNFEQLLAAAPLLVRMLDACAHLTILVTSRAVLRVSGEMVFPVPPLPVPQADRGVDRAVLLRNPAVALFVERAVATAPTFAFTDDNAAAIAEVCRRLDGLPLAIELAAARIKVLTPREICDRLTSRLELLTGGAADLPPRQQTLRNTLEWSHTLLNPAEQRFFRRLSVFPGGCTLEAAEAVCDTARDLGVGVLDGMSSLLDKHLVHQVGETASERRFSMLETVREFASGQLETYLESAKARQAHAAYCLVVAEEVVLCRTPSEFASWLAKCDAERENHRAALEYLVGSANAEWALRLGVALYRYWEHREYLTEGRAWFEAILTLPGAAATTAVRARALAYAATFAQHQGDHAVAAAGHRESLECWRTLGDRKGTIAQLNSLAACERFRGNYDAARAWGKETLDACRTLGDTTAIAAALSNLGTVMFLLSRHDDARRLFEEASAAFAAVQDGTGVAWCCNHLGDIARELGDGTAAGRLYEAASERFRATGNPWGLARTACDRGLLACDRRDYTTARVLLHEAVLVFEELGHRRGTASALDGLASLALAEGDRARALTLGGAALALRHSAGAVARSEQDRKAERTFALASAGWDSAAAAECWTAGAGMSPEEAIHYAFTAGPSGPASPGSSPDRSAAAPVRSGPRVDRSSGRAR